MFPESLSSASCRLSLATSEVSPAVARALLIIKLKILKILNYKESTTNGMAEQNNNKLVACYAKKFLCSCVMFSATNIL